MPDIFTPAKRSDVMSRIRSGGNKLRLAVFVDGCFWHGYPKHETKPKNNAAFWRKKFARNKERDRLVTRRLRRPIWAALIPPTAFPRPTHWV